VTLRNPFLIATFLLAGAAACGESDVTPLGTPELVLSEMRLGGADRVADRVASDVRFGQTVMDGIASGDSLWLEVAGDLPLKSAAAEASFAIALAGALPRKPERVLELAERKTKIELVCGMPFLDSTVDGVSTYYDSAAAAVARTYTPPLASAARQCGAALDSARARKLARIDPSYVVKNKPAPPKPAPRRRRSR
jgi:hypothetical protein